MTCLIRSDSFVHGRGERNESLGFFRWSRGNDVVRHQAAQNESGGLVVRRGGDIKNSKSPRCAKRARNIPRKEKNKNQLGN